MDKEYYAHSLDGKPEKDWQRLEEHLRNVIISYSRTRKCA